MHLDNFVYLATEVVDNVQQATLCSHENLANLARLGTTRLGVFHQLVGACGVVEHLATSCIVQRYKLAWKEVVLHFEESDVFFATAYEACVDDLVEF